MILVGLMMLILALLAFKHGPLVLIQNRQVRKALNVSGIVLQDNAARI